MTETINTDQPTPPSGRRPSTTRGSRAKVAVLATSGALVLAGGIGVASMAMADPTPTPSASSSPSAASSTSSPGTQDPANPGTGHRGGPRGKMGAELATQLAEKLGIDQAKVTTALGEIDDEATATRKEAFSTKLDEAVAAGTLTRAEADAVLKAAEAGVIPIGGGPR